MKRQEEIQKKKEEREKQMKEKAEQKKVIEKKESSTKRKKQESICEAKTCSHKSARKWVQCSQCLLWFHCICQQVTSKVVEQPSYIFVCNDCEN